MSTEPRYKLLCPEGYYEAPGLLRLLWEVFKHRCGHFFRGEGWRD